MTFVSCEAATASGPKPLSSLGYSFKQWNHQRKSTLIILAIREHSRDAFHSVYFSCKSLSKLTAINSRLWNRILDVDPGITVISGVLPFRVIC